MKIADEERAVGQGDLIEDSPRRRAQHLAADGQLGLMADDLGKNLAEALGHKDVARLKALLRPDVDFRAMTPGCFWESDSADAVVDDILLGQWFEPCDEITQLIAIETATFGSRQRVGYRFGVTNGEGDFVVEQQAYFEPDGDQIGWLRVMCAGFQATG